MGARYIGWFIVTTGIITLLPLMLEVCLSEIILFLSFICNIKQIKREAIVEEMERVQIERELNDGKTPQELANAGLTSALGPKVLTE